MCCLKYPVTELRHLSTKFIKYILLQKAVLVLWRIQRCVHDPYPQGINKLTEDMRHKSHKAV